MAETREPSRLSGDWARMYSHLIGDDGGQEAETPGRQFVDWQIGDFALCVTPGSKIENRVVMIVSKPLNHPDKPDVVYRVHPGFPVTNNWGWGAEDRHLRPIPFEIDAIEWKAGPFIPDVLVH